MTNLQVLLKYTLINKLNLNKLFKKLKKKNLIILVLFSLIASIAIFGFCILYMYMMGTTLSEVGNVKILLLMGLSFGGMMCFITNIPMCDSMLFHANDYELLSSMPIKNKDIIISKILSLIIINYGVMALLTFSSLIAVCLIETLKVEIIIKTIVSFLFSPLIPIALSSLCSFVFSKLTSKLKHKNLITTALSLFFVIMIMFISMSFNDLESTSDIDANAYMIDMFKKISYVSYLNYLGITDNILYLLLYIFISVFVIFVFILIISKNYSKLNSDLKITYHDEKYSIENEKYKETSLVKMEIIKYFHLPGYVLNTLIGPIMGTIMLIILFIQDIDVSIIQLGGDSYLALVVVALVTMFSSLTPTTASTSSLEGKSLWILKSIPINPKYIITSKIMVSLLTSLPFPIINGILVYFIWNCTLIDLVFIIIIPVLFAIVMTYLALYINLKFPRFDWDNPMKIVKNSASVMITTICSFCIYISCGIIAILMIVLKVNVYISLLIITLVLLILGTIIIKIVYGEGVKKFNKLEG